MQFLKSKKVLTCCLRIDISIALVMGFDLIVDVISVLDVTVIWELTPWFMKVDIQKCYDTIDQKRLISIFKDSIDDQIMVDTLYKFFNMPVKNLDDGGPDTSKGVGVPQGNPLSPLLANVYLNELDHFMDRLKKEIDKGTPGRITKEWNKADLG